jgi:hypothetical protein
MSQVNFSRSLQRLGTANAAARSAGIEVLTPSALQDLQQILSKETVSRDDLATAQKLLAPFVDRKFQAVDDVLGGTALTPPQQDSLFHFTRAIWSMASELQAQKANTWPATPGEKIEAAAELVALGGVAGIFASAVALAALVSGNSNQN